MDDTSFVYDYESELSDLAKAIVCDNKDKKKDIIGIAAALFTRYLTNSSIAVSAVEEAAANAFGRFVADNPTTRIQDLTAVFDAADKQERKRKDFAAWMRSLITEAIQTVRIIPGQTEEVYHELFGQVLRELVEIKDRLQILRKERRREDRGDAATKCLFVFSGPSGAGKDILINRLIPRLEMSGISTANLRRFTTRDRRPDETADTPFSFLSPQEFDRRVRSNEIGCVHTSGGKTYGCDARFAEDTPPGTAVFYSMRVYSFLEKLKINAEAFGINVRNILIIADQASTEARILMRSTSDKEKLDRIRTSHADLHWLNSHKDFKDNFFNNVVDNSDSSKLKDVEESLYQYVLRTIDEIT